MSLQKILQATVVLSAVDNMTRVVQQASQASQTALSRFERGTMQTQQRLDSMGNTALMMGGVITAAMGFSIKSAEDSEVAFNRVNQVFKSMGETTDAAARASADYASALAVQIGQEDETIMAAQAKIATFKHVSDATARMAGIYDRATAAAFDLEATGFGDAASNAVQLGKALEDPIKGITALRKAGVTFTAQEQNKIKTLVASNKLLDAQKIVLSAVEKQVGGVAAATATDSAKMSIALGEIAETAGAALLPVMKEVFAVVMPVIASFRQFVEENQGVVKVIAAVGVGLLALGGIFKVASAAISVVTTVWKGLNFVMTAFRGIMVAVNYVFATNPILLSVIAISAAVYLIYRNWDTLKPYFVKVWNVVKGVFSTAIKTLKFYLWDLNPVVLIYNNWSKIVDFFRNLWETVKGLFKSFVDWIFNIPSMMYDAGASMMNSLWEGIKAMAYKPIQAIKDVASSVSGYLGGNSLTATIQQVQQQATAQQSSLGLTPQGGGTTTNLNKVSSGTSVNYSPTITINGGENGGGMVEMLAKHKDEILRHIKEAEAKKERTKY